MRVIRERVKACGTELAVAEPVSLGAVGVFESFSLFGETYRTGIPGYHQIENASLAILAAKRIGISDRAIKAGVLRAKNPARFEIISENPTVIYDGGHNENGIRALNFTLERYFKNEPKTVIFACMKDKEIDKSLSLLGEGDTKFVFTTVKDNPRAMSAAELCEVALSLGFSGVAFEEIGEAYEYALRENRLVVICGSLYLYKDFREYYDNK